MLGHFGSAYNFAKFHIIYSFCFVWGIPSEYIPRSGITESKDICICSFIRYCQISIKVIAIHIPPGDPKASLTNCQAF